MAEFKSRFADHLESYIKLRRSLGFKFENQSYVLRHFDDYVAERNHRGLLTQALALEFAMHANASRAQRGRRYQVVRHFSGYLAVHEPETPHLDPKALLLPKDRPPAYIYSDEELNTLLELARNVSARNPIRSVTLHAMLGLAIATGMRLSEIVRLDNADVDFDRQTLWIRQTKFAKDRLIPIHRTTTQVLHDYAIARDLRYPEARCSALFVNMRRSRFSSHTLSLSLVSLLEKANITTLAGVHPRFHDLRHTFAVKRLTTWYRQGADVQALLPALATYMGHVHYSDTAYYLKATPELLRLAAELRSKEVMHEQS